MALTDIGARPSGVESDADFAAWFARLAGRLLNGTDLVVAGAAYRLAELEVYYHGPGHPDPFAHRDPVQLENGRWYFHRTGGVHRGGSFKGLDLAFGDGAAHSGVLIRAVVASGGAMIDGPSLTVDHVLAKTGAASPAALDRRIGERKVWDATAPVFIRSSAEPRDAVVYRTSRVGLSLKRAAGKPDAARFVGRPYRFLTEPRAVAKGKVNLVLALHRAGQTPAAIMALTGCPRTAVERYVRDFEDGRRVAGFEGYVGKELNTRDLCRLFGTWAATYGG